MIAILFTVVGCALLFGGGEVLVRGAVAISLRLGISRMLVGMTVVAFCTSSPELLVSVQAALGGSPDIGLGNVVGSNIANVGLVLGLTAVILPILVEPRELRRDLVLMVGSSVALLALGLLGQIGRVAGIAMLALLGGYIWLSYRIELGEKPVSDEDWHAEETEEFADVVIPLWVSVAMLVSGLAALVLGAQLVIRGASEIAVALGVPEAVVALTVVALGTSLPELATSITAARRGHTDVAVGNVIGSNAFNIMLILGTTAVISPLTVSERMARVDIPVMLGFTLLAAVPLMTTGRIGRVFGAALLGAYAAYVIVLYV